MKRFLAFWPLLTIIFALAFFLRIYKVADTPHDLYVDEVSIGWNAYSILKTGKDEYGVTLPLWFKAFGEYKLPVYIYLTTLAELFIGANALAVRLPSVVLGTLTVGLITLLVDQLTQNKKLALLTGLLLAILPMSLHFSRAGYEANAALFFVTIGTYLVIKAFNVIPAPIKSAGIYQKRILGQTENDNQTISLFFLGLVCFILVLYTYNSARFFVPPFFLCLVRIYWNKLISLLTYKLTWLMLLICLILVIPFVSFVNSPAGSIRATQEMYINDYPKGAPLTYTAMVPWSINHYWRNYAKYFSFDFLFFTGDPIGRHGTRENGVAYVWQLPLFILGLIYSVKSIINNRQTKSPVNEIFLSWLLIAPITAAFGGHNPHAVRSLNLVVPFSYFTAVGVIQLVSVFSSQFSVFGSKLTSFQLIRLKNREPTNYHQTTENRKLITGMIYLVLSFTVGYFLFSYLHIYYVHYPNRTSPDWSGGYKEALDFVFAHENQYQKVALTKSLNNGYAYLYFYGQFNPAEVNTSAHPKTGFGKYEFVDTPYFSLPKTLYVAQPTDSGSGQQVAQIKNKSGDVQYYIWEN